MNKECAQEPYPSTHTHTHTPRPCHASGPDVMGTVDSCVCCAGRQASERVPASAETLSLCETGKWIRATFDKVIKTFLLAKLSHMRESGRVDVDHGGAKYIDIYM